MPAFAAFLRGVSPMNCKMAELKACFEACGFTEVRTVLSSGNVVFGARSGTEAVLSRRIEQEMQKRLGRTFLTILRPVDALRRLLEEDPYADFRVPANAKRVVTFLREPWTAKLKLPIERDGARILSLSGAHVFTAYLPNPGNPVFMTLLQKTFGEQQTTRTWETLARVSA
jgi:uncharacterized protein (DUF1697 family)